MYFQVGLVGFIAFIAFIALIGLAFVRSSLLAQTSGPRLRLAGAHPRANAGQIVRREHRAPRVRLATPADLIRQGSPGHELAECAGSRAERDEAA